MARESERKFLVDGESWRQDVESRTSLLQFYIFAGPDRSLRVRVKDERYASATLKFGASPRARDEFEYPLPLADARALIAFAVGRALEKTRHLVPWRDLVFEIDAYHGPLEGLVIAELEGDGADTALPDWIGEEVTDDPRYLNAELSLSDEGPPR